MSALEQPGPAHEWCLLCRSWTLAGTRCPKAEPCPRCGAGSGKPCRRPSGHRADVLHAERYELAERIDAANGITYPALTAAGSR